MAIIQITTRSSIIVEAFLDMTILGIGHPFGNKSIFGIDPTEAYSQLYRGQCGLEEDHTLLSLKVPFEEHALSPEKQSTSFGKFAESTFHIQEPTRKHSLFCIDPF